MNQPRWLFESAHARRKVPLDEWASPGLRESRAAQVALPKGIDPSDPVGITNLHMENSLRGWFVTKDGQIYATTDGARSWTLWMDLTRAGQGNLSGVEIWGLTLGHDRAWAVGKGSILPAKDRKDRPDTINLAESPLVVSWDLPK